MAKRTRKKNKKTSIKDILRGKFLVEEGAFKNWGFAFFLVGLAFVSITSAHQVDLKVIKIGELKEGVEENKEKYLDAQNDYMRLQLQSEVQQIVKSDSIFPSKTQPILLVSGK